MFEQRFLECEKSLYLIAFGYLHNSEDARDCVQESAVSAFANYERLRDKTLFKTWITRILINKAKDFIKKKRFTEEFSDSLNVFSESTHEDLDLLQAVSRLKPEESIYITLRFYNDMTYEEAAKSLKQSASTVKYRTKKALLRLKEILEEE